MALSGLILNLGLNIILIPKYQAYGSAIASLFTQVLILLSQVIWVHIRFKFRMDMPLMIRLVFYILFLWVACWTSQFIDINWYYKAIGIMFFAGGLALLTGLFRFQVLDIQ